MTTYEVLVDSSLILLLCTTTDILAQTFGDGLDSPGDSLSSSGIEEAALSFVKKYLGDIDMAYTSGYTIGNMTYAYVHQTEVSQFTASSSLSFLT